MFIFRPEWTCGRYDEDHQVAIYYNLIEGMAYFFEDDSAFVIGEVLNIARNGVVDIQSISEKTGVKIEELAAFFKLLMNYGLLVSVIPEETVIRDYRNNVRLSKQKHVKQAATEFQDQSVINTTNAERLYMERVDGITSVMLELTYRCSEMCIHCYNPGATRNEKEVNERGNRIELDLNDYKRIIDELYEQGLIKVCLSGGDPFSGGGSDGCRGGAVTGKDRGGHSHPGDSGDQKPGAFRLPPGCRGILSQSGYSGDGVFHGRDPFAHRL